MLQTDVVLWCYKQIQADTKFSSHWTFGRSNQEKQYKLAKLDGIIYIHWVILLNSTEKEDDSVKLRFKLWYKSDIYNTLTTWGKHVLLLEL